MPRAPSRLAAGAGPAPTAAIRSSSSTTCPSANSRARVVDRRDRAALDDDRPSSRRRQPHRLDDLRVARAAAQVAGQALADVVVASGPGSRRSRSRAAMTIAGRAEPALHAAGLEQRLLHRDERDAARAAAVSTARAVGLAAGTRHAHAISPSIATVHEPHSPCSHAFLAAVRPSVVAQHAQQALAAERRRAPRARRRRRSASRRASAAPARSARRARTRGGVALVGGRAAAVGAGRRRGGDAPRDVGQPGGVGAAAVPRRARPRARLGRAARAPASARRRRRRSRAVRASPSQHDRDRADRARHRVARADLRVGDRPGGDRDVQRDHQLVAGAASQANGPVRKSPSGDASARPRRRELDRRAGAPAARRARRRTGRRAASAPADRRPVADLARGDRARRERRAPAAASACSSIRPRVGHARAEPQRRGPSLYGAQLGHAREVEQRPRPLAAVAGGHDLRAPGDDDRRPGASLAEAAARRREATRAAAPARPRATLAARRARGRTRRRRRARRR